MNTYIDILLIIILVYLLFTSYYPAEKFDINSKPDFGNSYNIKPAFSYTSNTYFSIALNSGQSLFPNEGVTDGKNSTLLHQPDGNVVLYDNNKKPIWATGTNGKSTSVLTMEKNGNLVLYDINHNPIWTSNSAGNDGAMLVISDVLFIIISEKSKNIWKSN